MHLHNALMATYTAHSQPVPTGSVSRELADHTLDAWTEIQFANQQGGDPDPAQFADLFDGYAPSVIPCRESEFDTVEINGVRHFSGADFIGGSIAQIDNENPHFYSVYVRLRTGGSECIGDFGRHAWAQEYAASITETYGWSSMDYSLRRLT